MRDPLFSASRAICETCRGLQEKIRYRSYFRNTPADAVNQQVTRISRVDDVNAPAFQFLR